MTATAVESTDTRLTQTLLSLGADRWQLLLATLIEAARTAEALGYDSVWAADRIVIPWEIATPYPPLTMGRGFRPYPNNLS